ncbi:hypothetical protein [Halorubrum tebenquichense]|uniref:hypothetical protein n=1 Tax=Halorubrum tebenquichense TaxID=119434 RepID=UPI0009E55593
MPFFVSLLRLQTVSKYVSRNQADILAIVSEDVETNIQLETLIIHLGLENVKYEPEQFPGVIYHPPETPLSI